MEKICPRCGAVSSAGMIRSNRAHCTSVRLSDEQRDYIARNYSGCLCHHCLENITTEPHPVSVRELANFLLDLSRTLMGAGAHTSRVVRNVTRIAESFGYKVEMTIFQMHITMTIRYAGTIPSGVRQSARSGLRHSISTLFHKSVP